MTVPSDYKRSSREQFFLFAYSLRRRELTPSLEQACRSGLEAIRGLADGTSLVPARAKELLEAA